MRAAACLVHGEAMEAEREGVLRGLFAIMDSPFLLWHPTPNPTGGGVPALPVIPTPPRAVPRRTFVQYT